MYYIVTKFYDTKNNSVQEDSTDSLLIINTCIKLAMIYLSTECVIVFTF